MHYGLNKLQFTREKNSVKFHSTGVLRCARLRQVTPGYFSLFSRVVSLTETPENRAMNPGEVRTSDDPTMVIMTKITFLYSQTLCRFYFALIVFTERKTDLHIFIE